MLVFGGSVNCVPWVYVSEILPLKARTRGAAIGVTLQLAVELYDCYDYACDYQQGCTGKAYLVFMVTNLLFVPTVYFIYPETSNVRLEDIDYIFSTREESCGCFEADG